MPTVAPTTRPAVGIAATATVEPGLRARLITWRPATVRERGPGVDADAAATAFTIEFDNDTGRAVSLNAVQVAVDYGDGLSASPVDQNSGAASGTLRSGQSKRGKYTFAIPGKGRGGVDVIVTVEPGRPTVVFRGSLR